MAGAKPVWQLLIGQKAPAVSGRTAHAPVAHYPLKWPCSGR